VQTAVTVGRPKPSSVARTRPRRDAKRERLRAVARECRISVKSYTAPARESLRSSQLCTRPSRYINRQTSSPGFSRRGNAFGASCWSAR
jgi:hypothetical protein